MSIEQALPDRPPERETALTIGVFDGVHRGHGHLLTRLRKEADRTGRLTGVVTFRNHPVSVLRPEVQLPYLTEFDERVRLLKEVGVDLIVPLTFDTPLSKVRAADFVALLQRRLRMRQMVIGPDFALGHQREGDRAALERLGQSAGFSIVTVEPLVVDGTVVNSSAVRTALAGGDVLRVAELLGRTYALTGTVVKGKGRGGPLGFPTANVEAPAEMASPGDGIYATWAHTTDGSFMAATSIGIRPTFDEVDRTIEAFVLDFEGDLYGEKIKLEFVRKLRDELKFDSIEALQEQVARDVEETRAALGSIAQSG